MQFESDTGGTSTGGTETARTGTSGTETERTTTARQAMSRHRLVALVAIGGVLVVAAFVAVVVATSGSSDELVVYSARSHYGEEQPFKDYVAQSGEDLRLFGGSASSSTSGCVARATRPGRTS